MTTFTSLCVYCGSNDGTDPAYRRAAATLGRLLGENGIRLVYGGGRIGLMGICADAVLAAGGQVTGIIPGHLDNVEIGHKGLTELRVVPSMHIRKQMMFELSDAIAVLPGGIGTLDETFEIITWRHLGLHDKPVILVDEKGYWQPFLALIDHVIAAGFAKPAIRRLYQVVRRVEDVIPAVVAAPKPALADAAERL